VVYTGTHDNPTTRGWFDELPDSERRRLRNYLKLPSDDGGEIAPALMSLAWSSVAALSMAPLQDLLNLGNEARMNVPGHPEGNWSWRCSEDMLSDRPFEWLHDLTKKSNRRGPSISSPTGKVLEAVSLERMR
jgi:4-alpha-glucanotransferase